jgi:hypothetical protein
MSRREERERNVVGAGIVLAAVLGAVALLVLAG